MSKFTQVKCWHLGDGVVDPKTLGGRPPDLSIIKKSILKRGYRAFATNDRPEIEKQAWYAPFLLGDEVRFYIDGSGAYRLVNCDLVDNELYFERLDLPIGFKPWIFYSWQSDYNNSRNAGKDALEHAIKHINDTLKPREKLELVESTRPENGAQDIVQAIKENLDRCLFAVFDVTNVARVEKAAGDEDAKQKCYPNANVVFELSYAYARKQHSQVLLIKKKRDDYKPDTTPFDFEHLKRLDYDKPSKLKQDILDLLTKYLRAINFVSAV